MEIRKLNTIRGIAAIIVATSHFSNQTQFLDFLLGRGAGRIGVMLFFLLSGFLMSYLYLSLTPNRANLIRYVIARTGRVIPLFLIVVCCSYIATTNNLGGGYHIPTYQSLLSHLTFLSGSYVLWTIPAEIHFYIIFLLLWWLFNFNKFAFYSLSSALLLVSCLVEIPKISLSIGAFPIELAIGQVFRYFLAGVLFGQLFLNWKLHTIRSNPLFGFALLIVIFVYPEVFLLITGVEHRMWNDNLVFILLAFAFFCLTFLVPESNRVFTNRIGDFLGKISYSIYLLHAPILYWVIRLSDWKDWTIYLLFLSITITISYLSYTYLEKPLGNLIRSTIKP